MKAFATLALKPASAGKGGAEGDHHAISGEWVEPPLPGLFVDGVEGEIALPIVPNVVAQLREAVDGGGGAPHVRNDAWNRALERLMSETVGPGLQQDGSTLEPVLRRLSVVPTSEAGAAGNKRKAEERSRPDENGKRQRGTTSAAAVAAAPQPRMFGRLAVSLPQSSEPGDWSFRFAAATGTESVAPAGAVTLEYDIVVREGCDLISPAVSALVTAFDAWSQDRNAQAIIAFPAGYPETECTLDDVQEKNDQEELSGRDDVGPDLEALRAAARARPSLGLCEAHCSATETVQVVDTGEYYVELDTDERFEKSMVATTDGHPSAVDRHVRNFMFFDPTSSFSFDRLGIPALDPDVNHEWFNVRGNRAEASLEQSAYIVYNRDLLGGNARRQS